MVEVIEFSLAEIHEFTSADVAPLAEENVTVQELGGAMGEPVGVAGLGMRPSPSAGAVPCGSMGNELAVTGGVGWVMVAGTARGAVMATVVLAMAVLATAVLATAVLAMIAVAGVSASVMSAAVTAAVLERGGFITELSCYGLSAGRRARWASSRSSHIAMVCAVAPVARAAVSNAAAAASRTPRPQSLVPLFTWHLRSASARCQARNQFSTTSPDSSDRTTLRRRSTHDQRASRR